MKHLWSILLPVCFLQSLPLHAQTYNQFDEEGNLTQRDESGRNFNPHNNDSTKNNVEIPRGMYVWTVDRRLGDRIKTEPDTLPHLFPQKLMALGGYGEYNHTGNNYSPRLSRIFVNRNEPSQFVFTDAYDQVMQTPDEHHFTNTLSPITNLTYDKCGDKTNGEDHLKVAFAVNAGKKTGMGFDVNYAYAPGYYQNQNLSHLGVTFHVSHLGDQYQLHALFKHHHQKVTESGGITNDNYVTHPERYTDQYSDNEIPTILQSNWNRNDNLQLFLTHRFSVGFYKRVKMTDEEIKARQFAEASKKENKKKDNDKKEGNVEVVVPSGRPANARIAGAEPTAMKDSIAVDSTRIAVSSKQMADSLLAVKAKNDSIDKYTKREFVPVTSFIHTLETDNNHHRYQAYYSPTNLYKDTYYNNSSLASHTYGGDSIYDQTKMLRIRNTLGVALLEGFNKYAKAGLKAFASHELRRIDMPAINADNIGFMERWTEHSVSIGGMLTKTQGKTLHYGLTAENWIAGEDAGQLKVDFSTDLEFPLFGDTVRLDGRAYLHRNHPTFFYRKYHSKHFWWDNDLSKETRTRLEGAFTIAKTKTQLRLAVDEIKNFSYLSMSYDINNETYADYSALVNQYDGNLNVLTAQIDQKLRLGPLHWHNIVTYQKSSNSNILPLPELNVFSNLYLLFRIKKVLLVELGANATFFTKYKAPDFLPQLNQYAVQETQASQVELGNFPFVDVYANLHLKHARFFVMMTNVAAGTGNRMAFLVPHYPQNASTLHLGISWNFFN